MEFLQIVILSLTAVVVLFFIAKLMGYRQISEMSFFDYIIGISIGSVAAEMSTNIDLEWWKGVTAMVVYGLIGFAISVLTQKSLGARKFISGTPIILMSDGKLIKKNMKKARIEVNDLLTSARGNGYFNLADIDLAVMETTGKISFMPVAAKRQLNPGDFNFTPEQEAMPTNVAENGKLLTKNIISLGMTEKEVSARIRAQGKKQKNILLAQIDDKGVLTIYD